MEKLKKTLFPFIVLALFVCAMGKESFFPSLRTLRDTELDPSIFPVLILKKMISLLWLAPIALGFLGWMAALRKTILRKLEEFAGNLMGSALTTSFFSMYVFALGINGILNWILVLLFFIPFLTLGWREAKNTTL